MKKFLLCMFVLVMALALVACGGTSDDTTLPAGDGTQPTGNDTVGGDHVHAYEEVVTLEPTCTSLGKKAMKCACGAIEGDELPMPFAMHDAKDATCTEDSVCATCGKLLVEKYGHLYVDSVVTEATCTTNGKAKSACHRCGDATETVIEAGHAFDLEKLIVSNGTVGSTCTKCGQTANFQEGTPILKLDFDSEAEFANYPAFAITKPDGMKYENSTLQTNGALWLKYAPETIPQNTKLLVSFDFKLTTEGHTHRGESIFSFVAGRSAYNWIVKYYQADGVLSTQDSGHNDANSMKASLGKWYNCVGIIDTSTNKISVYVDGVNLGTKDLPNHTDAKYNGNFELRFFDVASNGKSMPYYDNFKLVEIK